MSPDNGGMALLGLVVLSIALGNLLGFHYGWIALGSGLMALALADEVLKRKARA